MEAEGIGAHIQIKRALPIIYLFEELGLDVDKAKIYMDDVPYMQTVIGDMQTNKNTGVLRPYYL